MPNRNDVFQGDQCRIRVIGGGYFHMYRDDPNEISLEAIATATSRLCRFTGHLLDGVELYSVAEHSVLVSHILEKMGASADVQMQGLLHDASEAYLADIAAPFKGLLGEYYTVEERVMKRIKDRFLLPDKFDYRVKLADWYALFVEARQIVCPRESELQTWQGYEEHGVKSMDFDTRVQCWLPSLAKAQFLMRYAVLSDKMLDVPEVISAGQITEQLELDL